MSPSKSGHRPAGRNPWWIPPFLGRVPAEVGPAHLKVLGFATFAMFFENYDLSNLGHALPQIATAFGLDKAELGWFTGLTRLGALPAFFLLPMADRIGRRRLLLLSVAGMSAGSFLTALAQNPAQFVAAQIAMRTFIMSAAVTSFVIISEEFPAAHRGWGIGALAGVGAIGFGAGALLYGGIEALPFGWRSLYIAGVVPLLFLPAMVRGLKETSRFAAARARAAMPSRDGRRGSVLDLLRRHPRRAGAIALVGALSNAGIGPAFQFISEFLQNERGWTPGGFAAFSLTFGVFAIIGNPLAGRVGDRYGRRLVAAVVLGLFPVAIAGFYLGPPSLIAIPWTLMVLLAMASAVCTRTLAAEVFPTAYRGTGAGTLALLETVGVGAGLLIYAALADRLGSQTLALSLISLSCLGAAAGLLLLPETSGRELEEVSGESA